MYRILFFLFVFSLPAHGKHPYFIERVQPIRQSLMRLSPKLESNKIEHLSQLIYSAGERFKIDYRVFILILYVESNFNQKAKSHTGDFSIAQINLSQWKHPKNRKRLEKTGHYLESATLNESFAIEIMAEILHLAYKERGKKDIHWYATYHSKSAKYKNAYIKRIDRAFNKIKDIKFKF